MSSHKCNVVNYSGITAAAALFRLQQTYLTHTINC